MRGKPVFPASPFPRVDAYGTNGALDDLTTEFDSAKTPQG